MPNSLFHRSQVHELLKRGLFSWGSVAFFVSKKRSPLQRVAISPLLVFKKYKKKRFYILRSNPEYVFAVFTSNHSSLSPCFLFFYYICVTTFWKGFVGTFSIFSFRTCIGFFQEKWVSPMINPPGLSGFTQQKYTHFFGKWVALTHSTYGHTLYTLAKMGIFTS